MRGNGTMQMSHKLLHFSLHPKKATSKLKGKKEREKFSDRLYDVYEKYRHGIIELKMYKRTNIIPKTFCIL